MKLWAKQLAIRIINTYHYLFCCKKKNNDALSKEIPKTNKNGNDSSNLSKSFDEIYNLIPTIDFSQNELQDDRLQDDIERYRIKCGGQKHLIQQASLLGHLRRIGAFSDYRVSSGSFSQLFEGLGASRSQGPSVGGRRPTWLRRGCRKVFQSWPDDGHCYWPSC